MLLQANVNISLQRTTYKMVIAALLRTLPPLIQNRHLFQTCIKTLKPNFALTLIKHFALKNQLKVQKMPPRFQLVNNLINDRNCHYLIPNDWLIFA